MGTVFRPSLTRPLPASAEVVDGVARWRTRAGKLRSAAVNPGNSGGPLVNLEGRLIGINVAVYRGDRYQAPAQGISFAIPVKRVREAVSQIFVPETMHGMWFGARITPGVFPLIIGQVQRDSPADRAGLQTSDQVVEVNGKIPGSFIQFSELIGGSKNLTADIEIIRDGQRIKTKVEMIKNFDLLRARLGGSLQELTPELASAFRVRQEDGLLVAGIDDDGPLGKAGVTKGFLIAGINGMKIHDLARATLIISDIGSGDEVVLNIIVPRQRGRSTNFEQGDNRVKIR
jgi:serine protease Do